MTTAGDNSAVMSKLIMETDRNHAVIFSMNIE